MMNDTGKPTHRHKKRGSEYVLIGIGKMQTEHWERPVPGFAFHVGKTIDMREVAVYRSVDDGSLWVSPREEFEDGRFEALDTPPAPAPDAGKGCGYPCGYDCNGACFDTPQPPAVEAEAVDRYKPYGNARMTLSVEGKWIKYADHEAALKAKTDEIERLRRERDYAWERMKNADAYWRVETHHAEQAEARAEAAEASNKALREGLEPFAELADKHHSGYNNADFALPLVRVRHLRHARALLSEKGGE